MAKKYIDADLLRKEIEFAKSVYNNPNRVVHGVADAFRQDGRAAMCDDILKKIDSLQQEQPCDTCTNDKGCVTCKGGELWEGKEQPSEELEEEIKRYLQEEHDRDTTVRDVARHFANWQKEQELKDAVEGKVVELGETYKDLTISVEGKELNEALQPLGVKDGDRVRIIIIKEDKE